MKFCYVFIALVVSVLADDFNKCGCCPDPCCCVCITTEDTPEVTCPTTTTTTSTTTTTTTTTSTTTTSTTTPFIPDCNSTLDLAFVVDGSGSVGDENWGIALQFVRDIISAFKNVGQDGALFSMVTYSRNVTVEFDFCDPITNSGLDVLMEYVNPSNILLVGGITNTPGALNTTVHEIFVPPCDRKDTPNAVIVLTDGRANVLVSKLGEIAAALHAKTECVIAIGVTTAIDKNQLSVIASCNGREAVFEVNDFDQLRTIIEGLITTVCEDIPTRAPTTTTTKAPKPTKTPRPTKGPRPTLPPCTPSKAKFKEECFCCCPPPPFGGEYRGCC